MRSFVVFLAVFFSVYGGMHLYGFLKIRRAFNPELPASVTLAFWMTCMVFTPILIRQLERNGFVFSAGILARVGYAWMGIMFIFVCVALFLDTYRLVIHAGKLMLKTDLSHLTLSARQGLIIALLVSGVTGVYGTFEALTIRTEKIVIRTRKIPQTIERLRIAQISDVHLGLMVGEKRLENILKQVRAADPDILVSTGDLVDGHMRKRSTLLKLLQEASPKYGKFAVTGNHEYYAGLGQTLDFKTKAGFVILRGRGLDVEGLLTIVGLDDPAGRRYGIDHEIDEPALLAQYPRKRFTLLLKHRPQIDEKSLGLFDLQLSGHTHKGQMFPFNFVTKLYYRHVAGLVELDKKSRLYVSRGSGTWGPPLRLLAAPEVTLIDLVPEK